MGQLLLRGRLERHHVHAHRVHPRQHVPDRAVLPGRVHRLQHDQQRVAPARPEQLVRRGELGHALCERVVDLGVAELAQRVPAVPGGIAAVEPRPGAGFDPQRGERSLHAPDAIARALSWAGEQARPWSGGDCGGCAGRRAGVIRARRAATVHCPPLATTTPPGAVQWIFSVLGPPQPPSGATTTSWTRGQGSWSTGRATGAICANDTGGGHRDIVLAPAGASTLSPQIKRAGLLGSASPSPFA